MCPCGHPGKQHERYGKAEPKPEQPAWEVEECCWFDGQLDILKVQVRDTELKIRHAKKAAAAPKDEELIKGAQSAQWTDGLWYKAQVKSRTGPDTFWVVFPEYNEEMELPRSCLSLLTEDEKIAESMQCNSC